MIDIGNMGGQTVGPYELRELLGRSKLTAVYRAYQHAKRREVTVKVMSEDLTGATGYLERFSTGARAAASLDHPHIVPFLDYGTQSGLSYVVTRHLTGGTLAERIRHAASQHRPLASLSEIADLLLQSASALDYAHLKGVYHDGVRPENILFDNRGTAYVADFGIARLLRQMAPAREGLAYMAPERWRDVQAAAAADQYGLAMIAYQLVAGRLPFEGVSEQQLMYDHLNEPPPALTGTRPGLPEAVSLVLERALSKEPAARFRSATNFAQAFKSAIEGAGGEPAGFFVFKLPKRERQPVPPAKVIKLPEPANRAVPAPTPVPVTPEPPEPVTRRAVAKFSDQRPPTVAPVRPVSSAPETKPLRRNLVLGLAGAAILTLTLIAAVIVIGGAPPDFGPFPIPTAATATTGVPALQILSTPTLAPDVTGEGCILTPQRDEAGLYAEPVTVHVVRTLAIVPAGAELLAAESRRGRDGFIWYRVTHDGTAGWVHSSAVRVVRGECP